MTYEVELKTRLDELEALAEHVPPPILAERVTLATSRYLRSTGHSEVVTERIRNRFGEWYAPPAAPLAAKPTKKKKPNSTLGRPISTPVANGDGEKLCTECGATKPLSEFPKNSASKDGYRKECKDCYNRRRRVEPETSKKVGERACANGKECAGFRNLGHPAPLIFSNKGEFCFACEEQGRDNATMPTSAAISSSGAGGRG